VTIILVNFNETAVLR